MTEPEFKSYLFSTCATKEPIECMLDPKDFAFLDIYEYDGTPIPLYGLTNDDVVYGMKLYSLYRTIKKVVKMILSKKITDDIIFMEMVEMCKRLKHVQETHFLKWVQLKMTPDELKFIQVMDMT